jgi:ATP/maltotriose-dependent transcriptional regulator MalT
MSSVTSITTKNPKPPERRLFYPGLDNGFQVELRHRKLYLIRDGQELGSIAGILLDRDHARGSQLLLTPQFDTRNAGLPAALVETLDREILLPAVRQNGHPNTIQQHAKNNLQVTPLTRRENEVLRLIAAGLSTREIANKLVISSSTVKRHIATIFGKLGVNRRTQAVAVARNLAIL